MQKLVHILLVTLAVGAALQAQESAAGHITFNKDVAPILYKNCVVCHHPNDIAPMSLMTYSDARPWAAAIRQAVVQRVMPPWHADPKVGDFLNDPRLSASDIATIDAWVKRGAKEGAPKDLPPAPMFQDGWHIKPDVVLTIPETTVAAGNQDDYEYIYVPTNFKEDRWVQAAEVVPGDRRVVHHATVSVVSAEDAKKLEDSHGGAEKLDKYRYRTGKVNHLKPDAPVSDDGCRASTDSDIKDFSDGYINHVPSIYLPGHLAEVRPPGYALKIPAGSYLQFQVHYSNRLGQEVKDQTSIGLVFAKQPVLHETAQYEIWNNWFLIPPGDGDHKVTSCFTLPKDVSVVAYTAHMHFRGKSMTTEAIYPDGRHEVLFNVPKYDFRWQETYFLKHQFLMPKGTKLVTTAYFDNSPNNPLNPDPSKTIRWGEPSNEEMMGFWLAYADVAPLSATSPEPQKKIVGVAVSTSATQQNR
jgi:Copper type II ascorbate-dependent monooxygenase, C-terminal domain